jgi:MFS family permease
VSGRAATEAEVRRDAAPNDGRDGRLRADLRACTGDGATYSFMVGIGESYLAAFVVALGMSGVTAGLVSAAPPVAGGALQLLAPRGVRMVGSPRRWVMLCAVVQAASLLTLAVGAAIGRVPAWLVFLLASLYWTGALAAGGAWNTWVAELFPARIRARYFAKRNRFCQFLILGGLLLGGALISIGERVGYPLLAFTACFGLAGAARLASLAYLLRQTDLPSAGAGHSPVSLRRVLLAGDAPSKIIVAMLCLQGAVQVGQPYFNPFMLKSLNFSPMVYTTAIALSFVGKSIALPLAGALSDRHGARSVLATSAIGIAFLAAIWLVSGSPFWILPSQLAAGMLWGAYELATFLILLEAVPHRERTSFMSWYYLLNSAAMVLGSLLGAKILAGEETWAGYATVFGASTLLRLIAIMPFFSLRVDAKRHHEVVVDPVAVRASGGSIGVPRAVDEPDGADAPDEEPVR